MRRSFDWKKLPTILNRQFAGASFVRLLKRVRPHMFVMAAMGGFAVQSAKAGDTYNESDWVDGDFRDTLAVSETAPLPTGLPAGTCIVNGGTFDAGSGGLDFYDFVDFEDIANGAFTLDYEFVVVNPHSSSALTVTAYDDAGTVIGSSDVRPFTGLNGQVIEGTLSGSLSNVSGNTLTVSVVSDDGTHGADGNYTLTLNATAVPEPGSAGLLLAAGALGLCLRRRRDPLANVSNCDSTC